MLTLKEAAGRLGIGPSVLRHALERGTLSGRKVGPLWTVSEREVERYRAASLGRPGRRAK